MSFHVSPCQYNIPCPPLAVPGGAYHSLRRLYGVRMRPPGGALEVQGGPQVPCTTHLPVIGAMEWCWHHLAST